MYRSASLAIALTLLLFTCMPVAAAQLTLMVLDNDSYLATNAVKGLDIGVDIMVVTATQLKHSSAALQRTIDASKVIVVDVMDNELERYLSEHIRLDNKTIYALRGSRDDERLKQRGFIFDEQIAAYYRYLCSDNVRNMLRCVAGRHFDAAITCAPVRKLPQMGIYHPAATGIFTSYDAYAAWQSQYHGYRSEQATIALLFYSASLSIGQKEPIDYLITTLEQAGFNVLPCFGSDAATTTRFLTDKDGRARVAAAVAFTLKFTSALTKQLAQALRRLDVPMFNAISLYGPTIAQWRASAAGIDGNEVTWCMAAAEISGLIEPTPLAGKQQRHDPDSGRIYCVKKPIAENIALLVQRLRHLVRLQQKANSDKKLAIMFYNHSQGKQNIGASYLNVFASLQTIIAALNAAGYTTAAVNSASEIKRLILTSARNVGAWAPGELQRMLRSREVIRLPIATYKRWFAALPQPFRRQVIKQWGTVDKSKIMRVGNDLIIPALRRGNLVLLPEPARGWGDDPMKLYHDTTLYPHHQYLAVYLWLQHQFDADAIIHLGTHATCEWTPGKQAGLSPQCAPEVLAGAIANIYPYIVDDVGEGIQAKRRGRAVIISHLTPMLKEAGLQREYRKMAALINDYSRASARHSTTAAPLLTEIRSLEHATGIDHDLAAALSLRGIDLARCSANEHLQYLEHYLQKLGESTIPYGLHTFGHVADDAAIAAMSATICKVNPDCNRQQIAARLRRSATAEITALLAALRGRYITPGSGNDPLRNPDALPTGRNFYGFDPHKIPSAAAWRLGQQAAEEIIAAYRHKHQHYPDKVAVVLWATETLRNEGVNEATILYLLGVEPRRNAAGRVLGLRVIPAQRLHRPRIDVLISASGLYRDMFPAKLELLHQAVQLALRQDDIDNFVRANSARIAARLRAAGMDAATAGRFSRVRVFSEQPGSYGNGVSQMAANSAIWEKPQEIVDVFERRSSFAYGGGLKGAAASEALKSNLKDVDATVQARSSNLYALLDNDDVFQYLGGLSMAVRAEAGATPETLILRQQRPGQVDIDAVAASIGRESRSRYLNPQWIIAMQREDYAGARAMAHFVEYLWGWTVTTPEKVSQKLWQLSYEVYVKDKYNLGMKKFFSAASPWAQQSISARMLEAVRKGYWQADAATQRNLAVDYAMSVIQKGVACCDHTCNNPLLNQMVVATISLPGVMAPQLVAQFKLAVEQAAQKSLREQVRQRRALQQQLTAPGSGDNGGRAPNTAARTVGANVVHGYKMEKINRDDERTELTSSGVQWLAGLAVMAIIALALLGARRAGINNRE